MTEPPSDHELNDVQRAEICAILAFGGTREVAAAYVKCDPAAIHRESKRDDEFRLKLRQAESRLEIMQLQNLGNSATSKPHWRAAAWILERRFPQRYALRQKGLATVEQVANALRSMTEVIAAEVPDPEHRRRILDRLEQVTGQLRPERSLKTIPSQSA